MSSKHREFLTDVLPDILDRDTLHGVMSKRPQLDKQRKLTMDKLTTQDLDMIIDALEMSIKSQNRALHSKNIHSPAFTEVYRKILQDLTRIQKTVLDARNKK